MNTHYPQVMNHHSAPVQPPTSHMHYYPYSFPSRYPSIPNPTTYYPPHTPSINIHQHVNHVNTSLSTPTPPPNSIHPPQNVLKSEDVIESIERESEDSESEDDEFVYPIITMQKPSPYSEMKENYEQLLEKYTKVMRDLNSVQVELEELKRKRECNVQDLSKEAPASKKKKTENSVQSPVTVVVGRNDLIPMVVNNNNNTQITYNKQADSSFRVSSTSTNVNSQQLNNLVYIYNYCGEDHGFTQLKANGKRIFIDLNWNEICKFSKNDYLHLCIFVNTSTVDKVKDSDLIGIFKILRSDGDKVKISKIRENLRKLNLQNQFSNIGHIKFFIQIRGSDESIDYTDKILLYSKTQNNSFEPSHQKDYNELSKLFYQHDRFMVFNKVTSI